MQQFEKLIDSTRSNLLSFAISILKNEEDAQEVVQEVLLDCFTHKSQDTTRSYLFKSVRNRSMNRIRSRKRLIQLKERFTAYLNFSQLFEMENEELSLLIDQLPEKYREVLFLRIKAELKIQEVALILDLPEGTVKSRINKAISSLKANYKE